MKVFNGGERGTIIILVAAAMTALLASLALVVDVGHTAVQKSRLQKALDAAALAGARFLPDDPEAARARAVEYAAYNGVELEAGDVSFSDGNLKIICSKERPVDLFFGPALGIDSWSIRARSAARVGAVKSAGGYPVLPLGILDQELAFGQLYTLKYGGGMGTQGWYGALDITRNPAQFPDPGAEHRTIPGGTGARDYEDNLGRGVSFNLKVGDRLYEKTGNMSGPTRDGLEERLKACPVHGASCWSSPPDWRTSSSDCARFVIIPVLRYLNPRGNEPDFEIVGFAAFFIEGQPGSGNDCVINGRFLKTTLSLECDPAAGTGYGLTGVKLTD
ncbi:pilus assembly protein TadG-related protein [Desulfofundulus thermosubterraneus]|uniref:Putative Flp pilus-assembly TadE/G-like n=1 Tax=Desulfofundulus thermosubterraneus DSM 16057 TaxID=1121432 RepID=A0A1M6D8I0_9FIRM|nr:pilus assembly protein TadG-related protein [Desulfofundulus thermosubterraneus]SHI69308.1 Putative Flp pilus-assembly TadE/G-like [Desulfofundulus thermosubterraneus DSM 16057]